jgi:hypothetical protein
MIDFYNDFTKVNDKVVAIYKTYGLSITPDEIKEVQGWRFLTIEKIIYGHAKNILAKIGLELS